MPQSRATIRKLTLARIQRLCCLGIGSEMLMPDLMREVIGLIPSGGGYFYWMGPDLKVTNAYTMFPVSLLELYFKEFYLTRCEEEFVGRIGDLTAWPVSKPIVPLGQKMHSNRRRFLLSDYYNALWRPAGVHEGLVLRVRESNRNYGLLHVYRAAGEAPFKPDDVKNLAAIAGFVAHSMTAVKLGEHVPFSENEDCALFVADHPDGALRHADPPAQRLLMMALNSYYSPSSIWRGLREPIGEIAWLCRTLAATANGEVGQPAPVLRLRNPWGEFVLRAYWFGQTDGAEQTRQIGITIERRVPRVLALRRQVEDLPLTSREKQLCLLLAHDITGRDLADAMGVAATTVITHRSSIYAKLGVHSRAGLLAALDQHNMRGSVPLSRAVISAAG